MKNSVRRIMSLLLSIMLLAGFMHTEVFAAENNEDILELEAKAVALDCESDIMPLTFFVDATISVTHMDEGMDIYIISCVAGEASYVGVKDIVVWHKGWFGIWDDVAVSSGARVDGTSGMGCSIIYPSAKVGDTYKITCVHYAEVDGEYKELPNDSGEFKYWDE